MGQGHQGVRGHGPIGDANDGTLWRCLHPLPRMLMSGHESIPVFGRPFCFLRHGETEYNAQGRIAGSYETALTERGHAQARTAAEVLTRTTVTDIFASPMSRALDTARYVAVSLGLPIRVIEDIAERDWGSLEGQPRSARQPGVTPPDAETLDEFTQRVLRGLGEIRGDLPLIVAHSGVFRVLCRTLNIVEQDRAVTNALPLHFERIVHGWRMTPFESTG